MSRDMALGCLSTRRIFPAVRANASDKVIPDHVDQHVTAVWIAGVNIDVEHGPPVDRDDQTSVVKRSD